MSGNRARLIELVQRIMDADYETEEEHDRAIAEFDAAVPHPRVIGKKGSTTNPPPRKS